MGSQTHASASWLTRYRSSVLSPLISAFEAHQAGSSEEKEPKCLNKQYWLGLAYFPMSSVAQLQKSHCKILKDVSFLWVGETSCRWGLVEGGAVGTFLSTEAWPSSQRWDGCSEERALERQKAQTNCRVAPACCAAARGLEDRDSRFYLRSTRVCDTLNENNSSSPVTRKKKLAGP